MGTVHNKICNLKSGEAVYIDENKEISIEKDYSRLVEPTLQELNELVILLYSQRQAAYDAIGYRTVY